MEISTSLNLYASTRNIPYTEMLRRAVKAGFTCFDFNPADYAREPKDNWYLSPHWRENVQEIKVAADELGARFGQSHAFCFCQPEPEDTDFQIRKSIEAAAIAGVPWVVLHPWITGKSDFSSILEENLRRTEPYIAYAKELGVGIAIENVPERIFWMGEMLKGEAFQRADQLIALVDPLQETYGNVGICWDTGHAHLSMASQREDLLRIGRRLKVTHIADNAGQQDEHMPAFFGYCNWKEIVGTLREIGYAGTLNFETHCFTRCMHEDLLDDAVAFLYKVGQKLAQI